jgi:hypothetical protein
MKLAVQVNAKEVLQLGKDGLKAKGHAGLSPHSQNKNITRERGVEKMNERLVPIPIRFNAQTAGDGAAGLYLPCGFTLLAVSVFGACAGSPTTGSIDIQDDGVDIVTAVDLKTNALTRLAVPLHAAGESLLEIDVNFSGGSGPSYSGLITLWGLIG